MRPIVKRPPQSPTAESAKMAAMSTPQMAASNPTMAQRDYLRQERPSEPLSAPLPAPASRPHPKREAIHNHAIAQLARERGA